MPEKGASRAVFLSEGVYKGCTVEAHNFSEATDRFKSFRSDRDRMSNDDIDTLKKFSVLECRNKFAVARIRAAA